MSGDNPLLEETTSMDHEASYRAQPIVLKSPAAAAEVPIAVPTDEPPLYVCVSGQTGAGKSTILRLVADFVADVRQNVVVVDEKALHHPYLDRLFVAPDRYALELQLEFMVTRVLVAKRWLAAGYSTIMERSHLEDPVFIRHLLAFGHVTPQEHDAYMAIWAMIDFRMPPPDALILLDVALDVSLERLSRPSSTAERPAFPDEAAQREWIASWHTLYRQRFAELASDPKHAARIGRFSSPVKPAALTEFLRRTLPV